MVGDVNITITVGETYNDPGAIAMDNNDGNITDQIVVRNPVDTSTIGTYTITYDVNDSAGNAADQVTRTVTVQAAPNTPPKANATATPTTVSEGEAITFDGSGSSDSDGNIITYSWKEGNSTLSTQASFTETNLSVGAHTITLTVTDDDNATASDSVVVTAQSATTVTTHLKKPDRPKATTKTALK